jgi:hypothetical protein
MLFWRLSRMGRAHELASQGQIARVWRAIGGWNLEWGRQPSPGEENPINLAGTVIVAADAAGGLWNLLRVEPSGTLGFGEGAIRDRLGPRGRDKPMVSELDAPTVLDPCEENDPAFSGLMADEARSALSAIRAPLQAPAGASVGEDPLPVWS